MKSKLVDAIGIVAIFLSIITASIAFVIFFRPFYRWSALYLEIPRLLGMSPERLFNNYDILMDYLTKPWIDHLHMPDFPSSPNGLFHFYEVKNLFLLNNGLLLVTGLVTVAYILYLRKNHRIWVLIRPFFVMIFIPIVALFFVFLNFDAVFVLFHEIAFNNDLWIFNASTDPIILALPQDFFMYCFIVVFVLIELSFIAGYFWTKHAPFKNIK